MLTIETQAGDPIVAGSVRLVPIARSLRLELGRGTVVWNRPIAVSAGPVVPIRDHTRRLQLMILGAGLVGSLLLRLAGRRRQRAGDRGGTR